jgi:catechol 2,3-dioxygenase-like lactoylglutathione lyase family enzyme
MLGRVNHVGYLADDVERGIAVFTERFGVEVVRRFERPQYSLVAAYLGAGTGSIEVFSFTEPELQAARLSGSKLSLDHVGYEVSDIRALQAELARSGVRFSGPDLRGELSEPVELGGVLHLWTVPESCAGLSMQLMQLP